MKVPPRIDKGRAEVAKLAAERKAAWPDPNLFHEKFHAHARAAEKLRKLEREWELSQTRPEPEDEPARAEVNP